MSDKILVQQEIVARVTQASFFKVSYDPAGMPALGAAVLPGTPAINEVRSTWERSRDRMSSCKQERGLWTFQLILEFKACEASLESFENSFADNPPSVRLTSGAIARVKISDADYAHPPRQQPQGGTRAIYTLEVTTI